MVERKTGTVKWYMHSRGYGFIKVDDGSADVFMHILDFDDNADDPATGDRVSFVMGKSRDGRPRAVSVVPLPPANIEQKNAPGVAAAT